MQLEYLNYLIVLEQTGSINKACHILHTSPQNLSRILKQMEDELGINLFFRTNQGIIFTEKGYHFLNFCRTTTSNFEQVLFQIRSNKIDDVLEGAVTFYVTNLLMELFFNDLILKFNQIYPKININTIECDPLDGYHIIEKQSNIIGAFPYLPQIENFKTLHPFIFSKGNFLALVNNNHPLAKRKKVSIQELMKQDILCFAKQDFHKTEFFALLAPYITNDTVITTTGNLHAYYRFVATGKYVCFITEDGYMKQNTPYRNQLTTLQIEKISTQLSYAIVTNQKATFTVAHRCWLNFIKSQFQYSN